MFFLQQQSNTINLNGNSTNYDYNFRKTTQEKLTNTAELLTVVPIITKAKKTKSSALLIKVANTIQTIIYTEYPEKSSKMNSFSGTIHLTKLNGDFIRAYKLKNNEYVIDLVPAKTATSKFLNLNSIELNEVIIINSYEKPTWSYVPIIVQDTQTTPSLSDLEDYWWLKSGGGGSIAEEVDVANAIEEQIDDAELTGKAKCINDLLTKNGNTFVQKLLANFEGESEFDIKIVSVDKVFSEETGLEINGKTTYEKGNTLINIEISTSRTESHSALEATRIIMHEYIHADIYRKTYTQNTIPTGEPDFKTTLEKYGSQHGEMANLYINSMAEALKAFHKDVLSDDYIKYTNYYGAAPSDDFYKAFAWGGLKDANVPAWTALSSEQKSAINELADREIKLSKPAPCSD
jgi:hypothetical protein